MTVRLLRKKKWLSILLLAIFLFSLAMPAAVAVEGDMDDDGIPDVIDEYPNDPTNGTGNPVGQGTFDPAEHGGVTTPHILFEGAIVASNFNPNEPVGIAPLFPEFYAYNNLGNGQATAVEAVGFQSLAGLDLSQLTFTVNNLVLNEALTLGDGPTSDRTFIEVWQNGSATINLNGNPVLTSSNLEVRSLSQVTKDSNFVNHFEDFYGEGNLDGDVASALYQEFTDLFGDNYQLKVMADFHLEPISIGISPDDPPMTPGGAWTFNYTLMLTGEPVEPLDIEAPSTPQGLVAESVWREHQSQDYGEVSLQWGNATDNVGVDHYNVYLKHDGGLTFLGEAWGTYYYDGLQGAGGLVIRVYQVTAVDAAGNESDPSAELHVTTFRQENMVQGDTHIGYDLAGDIMAWTTLDPDTQQWYLNIRRLSDWYEEQIPVAKNTSNQQVIFAAWFNPGNGDGGVIWAEDHAIRIYTLGLPTTVDYPNPVTLPGISETDQVFNLAVDMPRLVFNKQVDGNAELWLYDLERHQQIKLADNLPIPGAAFSGPNIAYKAWDGTQNDAMLFNTGDPGDSSDDIFLNLTAGFDGQVYDLDLQGPRVVWSGELDGNRDLYLYEFNDPLDSDHIQKIGISITDELTGEIKEYQDYRPSLGHGLLAWEAFSGSDSGVWLYNFKDGNMTPLQETRQSTSSSDLTLWRPVLNNGRILYSGLAVNDPYFGGANEAHNYLWLAKLPPATMVLVAPEHQEVLNGSFFDIFVELQQAANVYGFDLELHYNPAVMQVKPGSETWVNVNDGIPENGHEPFDAIGVIEVVKDLSDNQTGIIKISATRLGDAAPNRYDGFYGDTILTNIKFEAVGVGSSDLYLDAQLVGNLIPEEDSPVYHIPARVFGGHVEVMEAVGNSISGWVRLEGTPDGGPDHRNDGKAGTRVRLVNQTTNEEQVIITDGHGRFDFFGLPDATFDLFVKRAGYLDVVKHDLAVAGQQHLNLERVLLLTGDLSRNNWVELDDLKLMRDAYGAWYWDDQFKPIADLSWDGYVGLIDLVLLARNFALKGASGPHVMLPKAWLELGQVKLKAGPVAKIYYTIGTLEALPADPVAGNVDQLYVKGTGIAMTTGQVIKIIAAEPSWGGISPVVTMTYGDVVAQSMLP